MGSPVANDVTVAVHEEFGEVPLNVGDDSGALVVHVGAVSTDELEDFVGVVAVDVNLGEHRELDTVGLSSPGLDGGFGAGLLVVELVARESENLESVIAVLLMDLNHFSVVLVGQTSIGGDVDDEGGGVVAVEVAEGGNHVAVDVSGVDFPKRAVRHGVV